MHATVRSWLLAHSSLLKRSDLLAALQREIHLITDICAIMKAHDLFCAMMNLMVSGLESPAVFATLISDSLL